MKRRQFHNSFAGSAAAMWAAPQAPLTKWVSSEYRCQAIAHLNRHYRMLFDTRLHEIHGVP
jgi:hypothetical protein